ncbi:succinate-semialdehyde dehydrogenase [Venatoribacter cucullus]|uniref:Succinate-semialdehyde dehydrogenase n=1 Tax=Venatoribacter cucullus TaxID=2661630 RepID=A0A9X7UW11_9GAMM|nr:NAD-dependent succinate-semialdehyde dehydrogenase [Venatoribacter cucullus]QQD23125.1 succinate-semialdehyde dehydrogenase [Venatoribacter cucullus]
MQLQNSALWRTQALINGEWLAGSRQFAVLNPADGSVLAQVADLGADDTRRAIEAAAAAMPAWQQLPAVQRSNVLWRWYELLLDNQEDLARLMTAEQGKPLAESRGEIAYGASYVRWFAEEARRVYGDIIPLPQADRRGLVIHQPVGVVAAITPWNFPNAMIARKVAPALAAGCAVVLKPAAETPLSALAMAELALQAGVPAGIFNVITATDAPAVGAEMTSNPQVRKVTFTGSTPVGKLLLQQCATTVKRTSMELGGNAPVIIFDDADLDLAINGTLAAKFRNAGQTCICSNRLLVQAGIYPEFVRRLQEAVAAFRVGNGMDEGVTQGPLISPQAVAKVHAKVQAAQAGGAQLVCGGELSPLGEYFYPPTILTGVTPAMAVWQEEIFGPVAPVLKFTTEAEAIALANDTNAGLAAYLFSRDMGRCWRVSEALQYGMVGVNETAISSEQIPFGGVKESGSGREGSKYGLQDYLETKYICMGGLQR